MGILGHLWLALSLLSASAGAVPEVSAGSVTAQPPPAAAVADARPYFVGELVVSGEGESSQTGASGSLDSEQIRDLGATTVAEALEHLPGVFVTTGGRNEPKAWVRGYEQANVLVLVDGVPISDPFYGDVDLGQLPVFDVARVTVCRGAASPLYGPGSLGGVINIVTFEGGDGRHVAADLRVADHGTALAHAAVSGSAGDLSWYLGIGTAASDGFPLSAGFEALDFEDGGLRVNSDFQRHSLLARVGWRAGKGSRLFASLRLVDADKGIPFHTTSPTGFVRFARFPTWRQGTVTIGYEHGFDSGGSVRAQLWGHTFDNDLALYEEAELEHLQLTSTFDDRAYGGHVVASLHPGQRHSLDLALHLHRDRHRKHEVYADGERFDPSQRYLADSVTLALQDRIRLGHGLTAVLSLAADRLEIRDAKTQRQGEGGWSLVEDPVEDHAALSPQAELRLVLGESATLTSSVYHRTDFPTMRELYGTEPANPALEPETVTGIGIGVEVAASSWLDLRAAAFLDRVSDLISRSSRDLPYTNQDEAEIRGLEISASGSVSWLDFGFGVSLLEAVFSRSAEGLREVPYAPESAADLLLTAHASPRVDLRLSGVHTGRRVFYERGERRELEPYTLLRAGVDYRVGVAELSLDVDNLLDDNVEQEWGYPLPGRRLWGGVRFRF